APAPGVPSGRRAETTTPGPATAGSNVSRAQSQKFAQTSLPTRSISEGESMRAQNGRRGQNGSAQVEKDEKSAKCAKTRKKVQPMPEPPHCNGYFGGKRDRNELRSALPAAPMAASLSRAMAARSASVTLRVPAASLRWMVTERGARMASRT